MELVNYLNCFELSNFQIGAFADLDDERRCWLGNGEVWVGYFFVTEFYGSLIEEASEFIFGIEEFHG